MATSANSNQKKTAAQTATVKMSSNVSHARASHKSEPHKPGNRSTWSWQKLVGAGVVLIALAGLIVLAAIFWNKLFRSKSVAQFFPVAQTVAVLEVNIDPASDSVQELLEILANYEPYQINNLEASVNNLLQGNSSPDSPPDPSPNPSPDVPASSPQEAQQSSAYTVEAFSPWIGRRAGIAWLYLPEEKSAKGLEALAPIIVVEVKDQQLAQEFVESQQGEFVWNGRHYPFKLVDNELFLAEQASILAQVETWSKNKEIPKLSDDQMYRKVTQNLPQGELAFGYIQWQQMWKMLEEDTAFVQEKGTEWQAFKPYLELFAAEGLSVVVDNGRFGAQTFTAFNNEELVGESFLTFSEKYQGELLPLAPAEPVFLMGGHDLTKEVSRLQDIFSVGTKSSRLLFEGLIEAQKNQYFGKTMDLKQDIYPLLSGEYLVAVEGSFQNPTITLVLEFDDFNNDRAVWQKAVDTFVEVSGIFTPHIQEVELPDGTKGKEIVAQPEKVKRDTVRYNDIEVTDLVLGTTGTTLHYALLDEAVAMSTNINSLHQLIDRYQARSNTSITNTAYFQRAIKPVLRTTDQLLQIKLGALLEPMGLAKDTNISKYLVPFNNFFMAKNFFTDGISTIYMIEVL